MSSSRSDGVTQFVRSSVRSSVCVSVPKEFLLSLKRICSVIGSEGVCQGPKAVKGELKCFKEVSRVFHGSFKGVSRKIQGCFMEVSRVFQGSFKGVSRKFQGCFTEVSRVFQGLVLN